MALESQACGDLEERETLQVALPLREEAEDLLARDHRPAAGSPAWASSSSIMLTNFFILLLMI